MTKPLLFTPIRSKDVTCKNRVVIAPMATYAANAGIVRDFRFAHWGRLVLGGAGCVFVEATAVTEQRRITNGDLGLWSSAHVPPLRRIAAFMKTRGVVPGIQIAHAGRKAAARPWHGNGALTAEDLCLGADRCFRACRSSTASKAAGACADAARSQEDGKEMRR
jgi:2,4-dienoyl-CoA reductase-like NADH-dependent reductase (Old Yellow Enzyme family)